VAAALTAAPGIGLVSAPAAAARGSSRIGFWVRPLDGSGENPVHRDWGRAGSEYRRLVPARYSDGIGTMMPGPNARSISNRVFNSLGVDLFSERNVSQWSWVWGQFLDHNFGLAATGSEQAPIPFEQSDPLEGFSETLGSIPFTRDAVVRGTGQSVSDPRQQRNTVSSYIDGWAIYGGTRNRDDWLRTGAIGHPGAKLRLPRGYLPRATDRGNARTAPAMQIQGRLTADPQNRVVAGDVRANENAELTAVHTLLAREHNRIVAALPRRLSAQQKFEIARRVIGAEEQYITYTEFLPALGVRLAPYRGYKPGVDPELYDEFATFGYRAHSMVNGEEHIVVDRSRYSAAELAALRAKGIGVTPLPSRRRIELTVSQNVAFFDPSVVPAVGLGPMLTGLADEPDYKNDEQIDDALRSVLFEYPGPSAPDPQECFEDPMAQGCFQGVIDLGAIDIERSRDAGMPTYDEVRRALGLGVQTSFTQLTGERTDQYPAGLRSADPIDDPQSLDFTSLRDLCRKPVLSGSGARAVYATRVSTLAARLRAIYGSVANVDAFVGMVSEPHVPGTEFGQVQLALWRRQFEALRDGDRFFYAVDPALAMIKRRYGISYRHTLAQLIELDTGAPRTAMPANVFFAPAPDRAAPLPGAPAASCRR
jgi:hypothetical protein